MTRRPKSHPGSAVDVAEKARDLLPCELKPARTPAARRLPELLPDPPLERATQVKEFRVVHPPAPCATLLRPPQPFVPLSAVVAQGKAPRADEAPDAVLGEAKVGVTPLPKPVNDVPLHLRE